MFNNQWINYSLVISGICQLLLMPVSAIVWNLYGRTPQKGGRYGNPLYWKIFSLFNVTLLPVLARDAVKRLGGKDSAYNG